MIRATSFRVLWVLVAISAAASAVVAQRAREDMSAYLPPGGGPGRALVAKECSSCHDLSGVVKLRKPRADWEAIVIDMVGRGAPLMVEDVDPIVTYLAEAFGPKAPPFTDANTATKEELAKLPGVNAEAADRLIGERAKAPLTSHEQVRAALGMDAAAFEKIKPYVYVRGGGSADSR